MDQFMQIIQRPINTNAFFLGMGLIIFFLVFSQFILYRRFKQVKNRYRLLMRGPTGVDLEQMLINYAMTVKDMENSVKDIKKGQIEIKEGLDKCLHSPELYRFNAFDNMGSDLSFSMSLLDRKGDGVVITSLYGRDETRLYAKPLQNGTSGYILSEEEKAVISKSLVRKN